MGEEEFWLLKKNHKLSPLIYHLVGSLNLCLSGDWLNAKESDPSEPVCCHIYSDGTAQDFNLISIHSHENTFFIIYLGGPVYL